MRRKMHGRIRRALCKRLCGVNLGPRPKVDKVKAYVYQEPRENRIYKVYDKRTDREYPVRANSHSEAVEKIARRLRRPHGNDLR